jgi:hypothetical protein
MVAAAMMPMKKEGQNVFEAMMMAVPFIVAVTRIRRDGHPEQE